MDQRERTLLAVILTIFAVGCTNDAPPPLVSATPVLTHPVEPVGDASTDASPGRDASAADGGAELVDGGALTDGATATSEDGLTPDFLAWLDGHGYHADDFARRDLGSPASFGGKIPTLPGTGKRPVVFVHGNSDRAIGGSYGGWSKPRAAFRAAGYAPSELYATTWGPGDPNQASSQTHRASYLGRVRRFLDAVLAYTGNDRVTVISHSMGVTLARRAIQGGLYRDEAGASVDLGAPLGGKVAVFVGLAGANYGLSSCYLAAGIAATCGTDTGFFPGQMLGFSVVGRARILEETNRSPHAEGAYVVSAWSRYDEILGGGGLVWGQKTAEIPGSDDVREVNDSAVGHFQIKDDFGPWLVSVADR